MTQRLGSRESCALAATGFAMGVLHGGPILGLVPLRRVDSLGRLGASAGFSAITRRHASTAWLAFEDRAFLAVRYAGARAGAGLETLVASPATLMPGAVVVRCFPSIGHFGLRAQRDLFATQNIVGPARNLGHADSSFLAVVLFRESTSRARNRLPPACGRTHE